MSSLQIYIRQNDQELGPYPLEEAKAFLETGSFSRNDMAWIPGTPSWRPLGDILGIGSRVAGRGPRGKSSPSETASRVHAIILAFLILAAFGCVGLFAYKIIQTKSASDALHEEIQLMGKESRPTHY
jgi:hypothetical protein